MLEIRTEPLHPRDWLDVIEREYFKGFLRDGGAAAKFVIADVPAQDEIQTEAALLARQHNMVHATVSAGDTRLHLAQDLFFAVTRALPWDGLLQRYLEALFTRNDHAWPRPGTPMGTADLAAAFGIAPGIMARHRDQWLTRDLWDDPKLARDYRAAMIALCLSRLDPGEAMDTPVHQWLRGDVVPASLLRPFDIMARIGRSNARAMLISLCHFLRKAGAGGLLLTLDLRPAMGTGNSPHRYTPAAMMDLYEVLRELIDDLEHLPGLFILALADQSLVSGDRRRTLDTYKALEMRIWPDVRPGDRQNPLAPLVTISL